MSSLDPISGILNKIINDHISGSGTLQQQLTDELLTYLIDAPDLTDQEVKALKKLFVSFKKKMADFAILAHFSDHITDHLPERSGLSSADLYDLILAYRKQWQHVNKQITEKFLAKVTLRDKQILLHSQSSVVRYLFRQLSNRKLNINIIQTESRPMMEGREQARYLAKLGYRVKIVTDTGFSPLLGVTDLVILGADRVYPDIFINKCGSHAITSLSRKQDIPVYVLADSRKFTPSENGYSPLSEEEKPPEEVWKNPPEGITPVNYYFEPVPTRLATSFITESHIIPGKEMPFFAIKK